MYDFRITYDKEEIFDRSDDKRIWQGIPSIEYTDGGKTYACFYSGMTTETIGNYILVYRSDDGINFGEPFAIVLPHDGFRCYDPSMWIDPLNRLWLIWSQAPDRGTYGAICDDPDARNPVFGNPFYIGRDVMMCRPTVLSTGEWIFPIAVWARYEAPDYPVLSGAYAYVTNDHGKTFQARGKAKLNKSVFDEHMFIEHAQKLSVYVRTSYGIAVSDSYDGGKHWIGDRKLMNGPSSRFHIRRLQSGRLLLIYHDNTTQRKDLTAFLSEDEGETWKYKLLLDERTSVSYPDAKIDQNGRIHIIYDRERGYAKSIKQAEASAREILTASITEEDIIAGELVSENSYLKRVINKLGKYCGYDPNPYNEPSRFTAEELAAYVIKNCESSQIIDSVFDKLGIPCDKAHKVNTDRLDLLVSRFTNNGSDDKDLLTEIIKEIRSSAEAPSEPIVKAVINKIDTDLSAEYSQNTIADEMGISKYYLAHIFKKQTGMPLIQYINERRIMTAKRMLCETDSSISEIAGNCGYSPSYFSEIFKNVTGLTPTEYRKLNSIK